MRLRSIRVKNYKGFRDSGRIDLGMYCTVVVGKNNVGKTALMEAFSFSHFHDKPHRHISQPEGYPVAPRSIVEVEIDLLGEELRRGILERGEALIPVPPNVESADYVRNFVFSNSLEFVLSKMGGGDWNSEHYPSHHLFSKNSTRKIIQAKSSANRLDIQFAGPVANDSDGLPAIVGMIIDANTYVFRAERRVAGVSGIQHVVSLNPDASNLAGALHFLHSSNRSEFTKLERLFRRVFPDIEAITIPPISSGGVQIRIWNGGFEQGREDLAVSLDDCGTGIGQVLAILFILVTAKFGRTIVIDEPNSFLHPGATRTLMQLLRENSHHQYIVTTHSPDIISAIEPERLVLIRWEEHESRATSSDGTALHAIRAAYDELGVRLSDVFGYDAVVWLEGPTEAKCFPILLRASETEFPPRTAFVPLVSTGEVESASAETVWQAYRQLTEQSAFIPRTVVISLDRENRTEKLRADLIRRSKGLIQFLPRFAYENYLLHSEAIAAIIKSEDPTSPVTAEIIASWLNSRRKDKKYYPRHVVPNDAAWQAAVNGPKLLHDLIAAVTDRTQDFGSRKVRYAVGLTEWLLRNDRNYLKELIEYVQHILRSQTIPTKSN